MTISRRGLLLAPFAVALAKVASAQEPKTFSFVVRDDDNDWVKSKVLFRCVDTDYFTISPGERITVAKAAKTSARAT